MSFFPSLGLETVLVFLRVAGRQELLKLLSRHFPAYIGLGDSVCAMRLADRGKPTGRLSSALDHWRDRGRHARLTLGPLSRTRPARPRWEPVATRETSSHCTTACRKQARDGGCRECMETYAATVRNVVRVHNEDGAQSEVVGRGDTDLGGAGASPTINPDSDHNQLQPCPC